MNISKILLQFIFVCFCVTGTSTLSGQQSSLSSLYMYNKYEHIPAYAGLEGSLYVTGNYRTQWQGLEGQPITQRVNAHLPAYYLNGSLGVQIRNRTQGPQGLTDFAISYNYVLSKSWGILSGGIQAGLFQYRLDGSALRTPDGTYLDGSIDHRDIFLSENLSSSIGASYGLSVYFINNFAEVGLSLQQFPSYRTQLREGAFRNNSLLTLYAEVPINILDQYRLSPSVLMQSDFRQTQVEAAVTVSYSGNVFGGIGARGYSGNTFDSVLLIVGWNFDKNYKLSYAYDIGVSGLSSVHQGSHEIQLNYNLNKKIGAGLSPKVIYNPRYM